jgi:Ring finger domain
MTDHAIDLTLVTDCDIDLVTQTLNTSTDIGDSVSSDTPDTIDCRGTETQTTFHEKTECGGEIHKETIDLSQHGEHIEAGPVTTVEEDNNNNSSSTEAKQAAGLDPEFASLIDWGLLEFMPQEIRAEMLELRNAHAQNTKSTSGSASDSSTAVSSPSSTSTATSVSNHADEGHMDSKQHSSSDNDDGVSQELYDQLMALQIQQQEMLLHQSDSQSQYAFIQDPPQHGRRRSPRRLSSSAPTEFYDLDYHTQMLQTSTTSSAAGAHAHISPRSILQASFPVQVLADDADDADERIVYLGDDEDESEQDEDEDGDDDGDDDGDGDGDGDEEEYEHSHGVVADSAVGDALHPSSPSFSRVRSGSGGPSPARLRSAEHPQLIHPRAGRVPRGVRRRGIPTRHALREHREPLRLELASSSSSGAWNQAGQFEFDPLASIPTSLSEPEITSTHSSFNERKREVKQVSAQASHPSPSPPRRRRRDRVRTRLARALMDGQQAAYRQLFVDGDPSHASSQQHVHNHGQSEWEIDNFSYEHLLHTLQDVQVGLTDEQIFRLPQRVIKEQDVETMRRLDRASCSICLCEFEVDEHVRTLPCLHVYHSMCIDRWLRDNKTCPMDKISIEFE